MSRHRLCGPVRRNVAKKELAEVWTWELEPTAHVLKRMEDRRFNEVELRRMLEHASGFRDDIVADRFIVDRRGSAAPGPKSQIRPSLGYKPWR